MAKKIDGGMKAKRIAGDVIIYIFLAAMCVIWLLPFFWIIMQSFRDGIGQYISTFLPTAYTVKNYVALFTDFTVINFPPYVPEHFLRCLLFLCDFHLLRAGCFLLPEPSEVEDA